MKRSKILFCCKLLGFLLPLSLSYADSGTIKEVIIPILIPMTGSAAEQGEWVRQGVELAEEAFNTNSKLKITPIFQDTKADPRNAISAYQSLKAQSNFPAIITYGSGVGLSLSSIVNKDQVIQMGVATSTPKYRSAGDYTFRNFPSAEIDAEFLVKSILERFNTKEIATIHVQNEYGVASKNAVKNLFIASGGKIIFEEELEPNGTDYNSIILRLKAKNPKIVYLAVYPLEGAVFLKQAKALGLKTTFIAGSAIIGSSAFMEIARSSAEGLVVSTTEPVFLTSKASYVLDFNKSYIKKFARKPNLEEIYAARAYDAFLIIANGIKSCMNAQAECLKNYLYKVNKYPGVSGKISFDKYGDITSKFELYIIRNGQFVSLI